MALEPLVGKKQIADMNKKNIFFRTYDYMFSTIYDFYMYFEESNPEIFSFFFLTVLLTLNGVSINILILLTYFNKSDLNSLYGLFVLTLSATVNYFYFLHKGKYISKLKTKYTVNEKRKLITLSTLYLLFTFILFIYMLLQ